MIFWLTSSVDGAVMFDTQYLKWVVVRNVGIEKMKSSMCLLVNGMLVNSKNRSHPTRSIQSPTRSPDRACLSHVSTIFFVASTASSHLGGLFGRYGIAKREKAGGVLAFVALPPTHMESPSYLGS